MKTKSMFLSGILLITLVAIIYSCTKSNSPNLVSHQFSEDEIFKGVMFNEGPVSSVVPYLEKNQIRPEDLFSDQESIQSIYNFREKVMNTIKEDYPNFLSTFKQEMTSGDPERVKKEYYEGGKKLYGAILKLSNISTKAEEVKFVNKLEDLKKKFTVFASDGTVDKTATKTKLLAMLVKNTNESSKIAKPDCIFLLVVGVAVVVAVIAGAVVEAAAATDTYFWVTDSESNAYGGAVDNKTPLLVEELTGQLAVSLANSN